MASFQQTVMCTKSINSSNAVAGVSPAMAKTRLCCNKPWVLNGTSVVSVSALSASPSRNHIASERGEQSQLLHAEVVPTHEPVLSEREIIYCKITAWNSTILGFVYGFISTLKCSCCFCHLQSIWLRLIIPETIPYLFQVQCWTLQIKNGKIHFILVVRSSN